MRWVERGWPTLRQARRSETPSRCCRCTTHWRRRQSLEVSREGLFQNLLVQSQFGHRLLEPAILLLPPLHPPRLFELQTAVLTAPAVVALFRDPQAAADLADPLALRRFDFGLPQRADDLLGRKLPTLHS